MKIDGYTRVYYGPTSGVSHLVLNSINAMDNWARCGKFPRWWVGWYGTGSQDEYDKAEALPLCAKCAEGLDLDRKEVQVGNQTET